MVIMQIIPNLELAGAETMCQNLSVELRKLGHRVIVVSLYKVNSSITKNLNDEGIELVYLHKKSGLDIGCVSRLAKMMCKINPDVIHSHIYAGKYAHTAAILAKIPRKVYTVHNIAQKESSRFDKLINLLLFHKMHVVPVALTKEVQDSVLQVYHLRQSDVPIVCNGIPLEKCTPVREYSTHAMNFIHVGRFCTVKNHENIIKGFVKAHEKYSYIQLKLYGDGPLKKEMEYLVKDYEAEKYIHFMGLTNNVYDVMATSDVFLLPSIYEGMPMTLIEAMATALPIITTPVGGIVDMLEDKKEAIFCDIGWRSIERSICELVENQKYREMLGKAAKEKSEIFSAKLMARHYLDIYQSGSEV